MKVLRRGMTIVVSWARWMFFGMRRRIRGDSDEPFRLWQTIDEDDELVAVGFVCIGGEWWEVDPRAVARPRCKISKEQHLALHVALGYAGVELFRRTGIEIPDDRVPGLSLYEVIEDSDDDPVKVDAEPAKWQGSPWEDE